LDAVVMFDTLPREVILQIVDKFLVELEGQLMERGVTLSTTDAARGFFAKHGYNKEFGAREMGRIIQEHVKKPLADELLFGDLSVSGHAEIDLEGDAIVVRAQPSPPEVDAEEEEAQPADV
jgi:ATP-dependent Clp protease ATP-binding subunit ClpA